MSVGICTHCIPVFARWAPDLHAQSVIINKISASELSQKFIKSALLVGFPALSRLSNLGTNRVDFANER